MRGAGIATVQQTLTSEAALVLKRAISDAQRRGHSQVTPLHVASSLLVSPASMLQSACIQSHRHAAPPLHCRALELCFNVALDRLPAASSSSIQNSSSIDSSAGNLAVAAGNLAGNLAVSPGNPSNSSSNPSAATLSNALVAALKRAQAHQRRGCPEQHQVPLLAIKVEMEQLVISILDDPSVSRVMREAGFSSTRAKSALEASSTINHHHQSVPAAATMADIDAAFRTRLIDRGSFSFSKEVDAAMATLSRRRRRNPVLLGDDGAAAAVLKELVSRIQGERKEVRIVLVDRGFGYSKEATQRCLVEIAAAAAEEENGGGGVMAVLGSLGWCVEQSAMANAVMGELGKVLARAEGKLWLVATASSQCYMRFLAQYPAMENGLDFQPLPVSNNAAPPVRPRFSFTEKHEQSFPRLPKVLFHLPDDHLDDLRCCVECTAKLEHESFMLFQDFQSKTESVQSSSGEFWMPKNATRSKATPQEHTQLTRELRKKWNRYCQLMHSKSCLPSLPNLIDSNSSSSQTSSPNGKIQNLDLISKPCLKAASSNWLSLSTVTEIKDSDITSGPTLSLGLGNGSVDQPTSTGVNDRVRVTTELALGTPHQINDSIVPSHRHRLDECKQRASSLSAEALEPASKRYTELDDEAAVSFKALYKGICEKVPWQADAARKIASAISRCRAGDRRRGSTVKRDAWLLLTGPDAMGKRKVAKALADMVYGGGDENRLVVMNLNPNRRESGRRSVWDNSDSEMGRGRTVTDRVAEAVRMNPFSLFLLEEFETADAGVKSGLLKCMERGKIQHSSGREISFGNAVMLLTTTSGGRFGMEVRVAEAERREIRLIVEAAEEGGSNCGEDRGVNRDENNETTTTTVTTTTTKKGLVSVIEFKQGGEKETVLTSEQDDEDYSDEDRDRVGEKRKTRPRPRSRWGEKLAEVFDSSGRTRRARNRVLDLNLGLRCSNSSWDCEEGGSGGHFDEVVCFSGFEVESIGEAVMERVGRMAERVGVCVEVDVRVLEMMVGFVWEEVNGKERFERWMEQWIEGVVEGREGVRVVRLVAGELVDQSVGVAGKNRSLLGQVRQEF